MATGDCGYGVFHIDTGFCAATPASMDQAEQEAERMNAEQGKQVWYPDVLTEEDFDGWD
jgi:hypothetical protein